MLIDGNVATGYSVLDDRSLFAWNESALEDGNPQGGAGYVRNTVRDMLTWAKAVMEAESDHRLSINHEVDGNDLGSSSEVLQQIPYIRTREAAVTAKLMWPALVEEFVTKRIQNTKHRPLEDYVGTYQSTDFRFTFQIYELPEAEVAKGPNLELLGFNINSLPKQKAKLRHYHYDSWIFIPYSRDDAIRKGMEGFLQLSLLIVNFVADESNELQWLEWDLQGGKLGAAVSPIQFQRIAISQA
ncbi:MAG: hypothetical protein Q9164_007407 [Protoblastenia rupestris]